MRCVREDDVILVVCLFLFCLVAIPVGLIAAAAEGLLGCFRHRHDWRLVWFMGNLWTECAVCGESHRMPFGDLAEIPQSVVDAAPDMTPTL